MVKKRDSSNDASISMDSFLDILTCLVGVLVLIIILTSIDASQTKVLIPTPMSQKSDKKLLFVECRNEQLFPVPLDEMQNQIEQEFNRLDKTLSGDPEEMKEALENLAFETDNYIIDSSYALVGQIAITPRPDSTGDDLSGVNMQAIEGVVVPGWYGEMLDNADPTSDIITFLVRDNSFRVFKKARALAWVKKIQVTYELLSVNDPIIFGLGGDIALAQ